MIDSIPDSVKYALILFVEILAYCIFVYFVVSKTTGQVARRWKASVFSGVVFGLCFHLFFSGLLMLGWLLQVNFVSSLYSQINGLLLLAAQIIVLDSIVIMPIIIVGTFIAFGRFASSGDQLIEKHWRNPKIHYGEYKRPPF